MSQTQTESGLVCPHNLGKVKESCIKGSCTGGYFSRGFLRQCPTKFNYNCPIMFGNALLQGQEVSEGLETKPTEPSADVDMQSLPEARQ